MWEFMPDASPRLKARLAGAFYLLNIVTSLIAFSGAGGKHWLAKASGLLATASYIAVAGLLYDLFKPVDKTVSLIAACFSVAGSAVGVLAPLHLVPLPIHSLVFFGCYCVLLAWLIWRSTFLPGFLAAAMLIAGVGWLTFLSPSLAKSLVPYHYIGGGIGEGLLTVWLLGAKRWNQQAAAHASIPGEYR